MYPPEKEKKLNWSVVNFILIIILAIVVVIVGFFVFKAMNQNETIDEKDSIISQGYFQGQIEYVEGEVEKRESESMGWLSTEKSELISQGNEIRTLADSRAILTFEDGSVLRMDADTEISFQPGENSIEIVLNKGIVFNKVSKSETRKYSVDAGEFKVIALGTAFSVEKENAEVMVLESEVEVVDKDDNRLEKIETGNKARVESSDVKKEEISEKDTEEKFLAWNMEKDNLKYEEKEADDEKEKKEESSQSVSLIELSGETSSKGVKLSWKTDVSPAKGFKIVKSKSKDPVYPGDYYLYLSNGKMRSYEWEIDSGEKYYFRVCEYLGDKCGTYSNNVYLDTPEIDKDDKDEKDDKDDDDDDDYASKVSLSAEKHDDYVKLSWSISGGDAPKGFKVVKSKDKNPVYPGNDYKYLTDEDERSYKWKDDLKEGKKYYFRVCVYKGGKCGTYSNNVSVEF